MCQSKGANYGKVDSHGVLGQYVRHEPVVMAGLRKGYVLEEDDDEGVLLEDSGVLGILDKLVAMNSALFVSGAKRCGRVR